MSNRRSLSFSKRTDILEFLRKVCHSIGEGFCRYDGAWTDGLVAEKLGVSPTNVASVRKDILGKLRDHTYTSSPEVEKLREEVALLRNTVDDLHRWINGISRERKTLSIKFDALQSHVVAKLGYRPPSTDPNDHLHKEH